MHTVSNWNGYIKTKSSVETSIKDGAFKSHVKFLFKSIKSPRTNFPTEEVSFIYWTRGNMKSETDIIEKVSINGFGFHCYLNGNPKVIGTVKISGTLH